MEASQAVVGQQDSAWTRFSSGLFVRLFLLVVIVNSVIYALPVFSAEQFELVVSYAAEAMIIAVALGAILYRVSKIASAPERRFWLFVAASFVPYLLTFTFYVDWEGTFGALLGLLEDLLHLLFYAALFMAVVSNPHLSSRGRIGHSRRRIESVGSLVFSFGLIVYFVLIPGALGTGSVESYAPQVFVFALLDLSLMISFLYLRKICDSARWSAIYGFMALGLGIWAVLDLSEALSWWELIPETNAGYLDFLWYLPHLATIFAARVRDLDLDRGSAGTTPTVTAAVKQFGLGAPITVFLVFFPLMHLGLYAAGVLDARSHDVREVSVLIIMCVLMVVALFRQRREERERRELDEQLRHSQKMEAIGRLAGGISHDFNNLLTVIAGSSELALRRLTEDGPERRLVQNIAEAGDKGKALTTQLLAFSRRQPLDTRVLDLNEVIEKSGRMLKRVLREEIELVIATASVPCPVPADRNQLEQVLLNFALNAQDAMPGGGRLVLTTGWIEDRSAVPVTTAPADRYAMFSVRDAGSGMDEETLRRAFDPFFTTKEVGKGTGLGLTTTYGIVQRHGGEVLVMSEPGKGTTMTVYLPGANAAESLAGVDSPVTAAPVAGTETILVVEDEQMVRDVVRENLERMGFNVLAAENAQVACRLFAEHGTRIAMVLADVIMPGMSGPELYRELVRERPHLRVLFMSGYSPADLFEGDHERDLPLITKPFDGTTLGARIREILDA